MGRIDLFILMRITGLVEWEIVVFGGGFLNSVFWNFGVFGFRGC